MLKRFISFFKNLIIGSYPITDYLALGIPPGREARARWQIGGQSYEVCTAFILYDPPLVALDLKDQVFPKELMLECSKLIFMDQDRQKVLGIMELPAQTEIELDDKTFLVYQVANGKQVLKSVQSYLVNALLYHRLKKGHRSFLTHFDKRVYRIIGNFFLNPREVRLLTMHDKGGSLLHFPLDLFMQTSNHAYFGLRKTNKAVDQLTEGTFLCLSDVLAIYRSTIYRLGKFGGDVKEAPQMIESEKLSLSIPEVFNHYLELEIVKLFPFEHQSLFQARVINEFRVEDQKLVLAHIQRFRYLQGPLVYEHQIL